MPIRSYEIHQFWMEPTIMSKICQAELAEVVGRKILQPFLEVLPRLGLGEWPFPGEK
jgi:hypothetical protein